METKKMKLSVILPTLNRGEVLLDTVRQVLKQPFKDFELLIVDQTAQIDPELSKLIKKADDDRIRYFHVAPASLPAARNYAISQAATDFILFLDDDVEIDDNLFAEHYKTLSQHSEFAAVAGRIEQDGHARATELAHFDRYGIHRSHFNYLKSQEATTFPGGNMSFRLKVLKEIGGFDTSYIKNAIREETDVSYRLRKAGYRIYFNTDAWLLHLAAPTGGTRIPTHPTDNPVFYQNDFRFTFLHVRLRWLPLALIKKFGMYVFSTKNPIKLVKRTGYFFWGIVVAIKRLIWPIKVTCIEVA